MKTAMLSVVFLGALFAQEPADLPINMKYWKPGSKGIWAEAGELSIFKVSTEAKTIEVRPRAKTNITLIIEVPDPDKYKAGRRFPNRAEIEVVDVKTGSGAVKGKDKKQPKGSGYTVKAKLLNLPK